MPAEAFTGFLISRYCEAPRLLAEGAVNARKRFGIRRMQET
jgi:hypothetical protein